MGHLTKVQVEVVKWLKSNRRVIRLIGKLNLSIFPFISLWLQTIPGCWTVLDTKGTNLYTRAQKTVFKATHDLKRHVGQELHPLAKNNSS